MSWSIDSDSAKVHRAKVLKIQLNGSFFLFWHQ